ncbi:hypothetical protein P152DRAFT_58715 [Eremomyces bilateralis CBS 781.70]|uniref:Uncharacterized protein n=1 Tax=Eremomyces bilateralis CBS 781.70 TaxID=1392243 RepID=A0A6G1G0F5_9PEZI|nr:uncharacterized protein P152DRAFT_58715 [Eremomyces bilateralis CBS 781.70]KAF1811523.1 hypothetical protein P152DRAFT_58715 [Eremomyces bilateralis CBS 781.70]
MLVLKEAVLSGNIDLDFSNHKFLLEDNTGYRAPVTTRQTSTSWAAGGPMKGGLIHLRRNMQNPSLKLLRRLGWSGPPIDPSHPRASRRQAKRNSEECGCCSLLEMIPAVPVLRRCSYGGFDTSVFALDWGLAKILNKLTGHPKLMNYYKSLIRHLSSSIMG